MEVVDDEPVREVVVVEAAGRVAVVAVRVAVVVEDWRAVVEDAVVEDVWRGVGVVVVVVCRDDAEREDVVVVTVAACRSLISRAFVIRDDEVAAEREVLLLAGRLALRTTNEFSGCC